MGSTIGLAECLLRIEPLQSYRTASFTHLLFFEKNAMLAEAQRSPELLRSLWWYVAWTELRKSGDYGSLPLPQLSALLSQCQFVAIPKTRRSNVRGG